jgi:hypothetical protein
MNPFVILVEYGVLTLALQSTKIPNGYQMVDSRDELHEMFQECKASSPPVNCPYGVWRPKEKI